MQFKNIDEQLKAFIFILKKNKKLMAILDYISELNMPNFYIAAGSVFQTIWNYYDNKDLNFGIKDIDVIYFNNDDLSVEKAENEYEKYRIIQDQEYISSMDKFYNKYLEESKKDKNTGKE